MTTLNRPKVIADHTPPAADAARRTIHAVFAAMHVTVGAIHITPVKKGLNIEIGYNPQSVPWKMQAEFPQIVAAAIATGTMQPTSLAKKQDPNNMRLHFAGTMQDLVHCKTDEIKQSMKEALLSRPTECPKDGGQTR